MLALKLMDVEHVDAGVFLLRDFNSVITNYTAIHLREMHCFLNNPMKYTKLCILNFEKNGKITKVKQYKDWKSLNRF